MWGESPRQRCEKGTYIHKQLQKHLEHYTYSGEMPGETEREREGGGWGWGVALWWKKSINTQSNKVREKLCVHVCVRVGGGGGVGGGGILSGLIKDYNYVGTMHVSPETAPCRSSPILLPSAPLHIWTQTTGKYSAHLWYHRFTSLTPYNKVNGCCSALTFCSCYLINPVQHQYHNMSLCSPILCKMSVCAANSLCTMRLIISLRWSWSGK